MQAGLPSLALEVSQTIFSGLGSPAYTFLIQFTTKEPLAASNQAIILCPRIDKQNTLPANFAVKVPDGGAASVLLAGNNEFDHANDCLFLAKTQSHQG